MIFNVSSNWRAKCSGSAVGVLSIRDVVNPPRHAALDARKSELENELRSRFAGFDRTKLRNLPTFQAYHAYYKRFKGTYHVQLQLESIAWKGRRLPQVAALVEAMFMAELKNGLLTAGHDLEAVEHPLRLDVAKGSERYVRLNGEEQQLKRGDMMIADANAVISSVLYGPDDRTRITPNTRHVLFTVYAPAGITAQAVHRHLEDIRSNVSVVAPASEPAMMEVYTAE